MATYLKNFVSEIRATLSMLSRQFHPIALPSDEEKLLSRLKKEYVTEEDSAAATEKKIRASVCGTVLTSYEMSLTSTMGLVTSKVKIAEALVDQFKTLETNAAPR